MDYITYMFLTYYVSDQDKWERRCLSISEESRDGEQRTEVYEKETLSVKRKARREKQRLRGRKEREGKEKRRDLAQHNLLWFPFSGKELRSKWQCEIFKGGPGTETSALSDVTQLQCPQNSTLLETLFLHPALNFISKSYETMR